MKSKVTTLFCLFLMAGALFSQEYIVRKLAEKCAAKDLTFLVTFDTRTVNADFAKGDKYAIGDIKNANLGLRGIVGFDGQQAFQPEAGEYLRYPVEGNADPHKGTLIMWAAGMDYAPMDKATDGKNRGNIALAHLMFDNAGRNVYYQFYMYEDKIYFEWWSSEPPHGFSQLARTTADCKGFRKGKWFQVAATWDDKTVCLYVNGKKISEVAHPQKVEKTYDIKAENNAKSFIGVKSPFWGDEHKWATAVDDFAIYSRPMTALEIENQYIALLKDKSGVEIREYSLELNGVCTGKHDKIERLEVEFDFAALNEKLAEKLKKGELEVKYEVIAPDGKKLNGTWTFKEGGDMCRILDGINQVGEYTVNTSIGESKVSAKTYRPDYSWIGNGFGDDDVVPPMWKDFAVKDRTVTLWNRQYFFGDGPLPEKITCYGNRQILAKAPKLLIDGKEPKWKRGKVEKKVRYVVLNGTGTIGKAQISYATKVEYDGMIKFDWTIDGSPEISSMNLEWQMAPENHQFLMRPILDEDKEQKRAFPYPKMGGSAAAKMLWFVSEKKGGFAYTMESDANWRYDAEKPVFFVDKGTGECRVEMINQKTQMPKGVDYSALFIATPVRPLPKENRLVRLDGGKYSLIGSKKDWQGACQHMPGEEPNFTLVYRNRAEHSISIYGATGSLTSNDPEAAYIRKYVEVPGEYKYIMNKCKPLGNGEYKTTFGTSQPFCESCCIGDYLLYSQHKLYTHPLSSKFWQVYYDLAGDGMCGNRLHGCCFEDKFGRTIRKFSVLNSREIMRRTLVYAHQNGKTFMVHAQRDFIPFMHGMIDYWYPGEQHNGLLARNPYGYVDELADDIYRSEFNRNVLGVGVIHLPALLQAKREYAKEPKYTEAMIGMMMVHDVETCNSWISSYALLKCWNILERYGVGKPETECRLYYEQKEILSSDPNVRVTYYKCPEGKYVIILQNKNVRASKVNIDMSALMKDSFTAYSEYNEKEVQVTDGKFEISVPSRRFCIVCFPKVEIYPIKSSCDRLWGTWQSKELHTWFRISKDGVNNTPCLEMKTDDKPNGCFTNTFSIKPGRTYTLKVKARHTKLNEKFSLALQATKDKKLNGADLVKREYPSTLDWSELTLKFTPNKGKWKEANGFMLTMAGTGANSSIFFDDFSIEESQE